MRRVPEEGDEPGALESRFWIEEIDPEKGRTTGYVAKYISKCIDGYEVGQDAYGRDAVESAARIRAWSSIWGIRQFQFIGSPRVTVYREHRRSRSVPGARTGLIEQLEKTADTGNWKLLVELMGGARTKLTDQPLRAMMVLQPSENKYFEQTKKLLGLFGVAGEVVTRLYEWTIRVRSQEDRERPSLEFCQ
ncbi:MAG: hypothetical protein CL583_07340 [Alteromonadaceae bacterium]|nr:hypothetical protein [Alteromonadaceae bacterium]